MDTAAACFSVSQHRMAQRTLSSTPARVAPSSKKATTPSLSETSSSTRWGRFFSLSFSMLMVIESSISSTCVASGFSPRNGFKKASARAQSAGEVLAKYMVCSTGTMAQCAATLSRRTKSSCTFVEVGHVLTASFSPVSSTWSPVLKTPGLAASSIAASRSTASKRFSGSAATTSRRRPLARSRSWASSGASCSRTFIARTEASCPSRRNLTTKVRPSVSSSSSESAAQLLMSSIAASNHSPLNLHSTIWSFANSFFSTVCCTGFARAIMMESVLSWMGCSCRSPETAALADPGTTREVTTSFSASGSSVALTRKSTADCSSSKTACVLDR
mmetsp:Transcript_82256/g.197233  ORF Transcript_82256/g.197233 Transcript_82256/m.197233 type:complete len:331 (-) Transcript_82256:1339-2331(-)